MPEDCSYVNRRSRCNIACWEIQGWRCRRSVSAPPPSASRRWRRTPTELVARAFDLGINFFNTATHYGNRELWDRPGVPAWTERKSAEEILGQALKGRRHDAIITTKVGMDIYQRGDRPNSGGRYGGGLTRRMITDRVEMSLRRLQTDYVDFLYAQSVDKYTPLEITLRAFDDLVRQGKVLYYGISNFPAWQMVDAVRICQVEHLHPIIGEEIAYNLVNRDVEKELIPAAQHFGLGLTTFASLAGGLLTGMETLQDEADVDHGHQPLALRPGLRLQRARHAGGAGPRRPRRRMGHPGAAASPRLAPHPAHDRQRHRRAGVGGRAGAERSGRRPEAGGRAAGAAG